MKAKGMWIMKGANGGEGREILWKETQNIGKTRRKILRLYSIGSAGKLLLALRDDDPAALPG